jgi:hypothetical protein
MPNSEWMNETSTTASSSQGSHGTERSQTSKSTVPTELSSAQATKRQQEKHYSSARDRTNGYIVQLHNDRGVAVAERESVCTYVSSDDEEGEDFEPDDHIEHDVPSYTYSPSPTEAIPATPRDFAEYFPSSKRLFIRHDDSTIDGNMNLRVDTQVENRRGKKINLTLFHLRMHELKSRDFSLRRYCRDSGREVCHSIRKYQKPPPERPMLQRSFSSALAPFRHKNESRPTTASGLKRSDSGYSSIQAPEPENTPASAKERARQRIPTNTIKLEFSNYSHVDIKRRGAKSGKRYVFEYWDVKYIWKRRVRHDEGAEQVSFYLYRDSDDQPLAHIVPIKMSASQRHEEAASGGWIPPSAMRILDDHIINATPDVSE